MQNIFCAILILLGSCAVQAENLAGNGIFSREITLVNSIPYEQYGICFVGKVPVGQFDADLALFKMEDDKKVLFQAVPEPDGETYSLYASLNHSDPDFSILPYASLTLQPEQQLVKKADFKSSLSINAETGEMGNHKIRIKIDKLSGTISSLKHNGVDHDLADISGNGKNGLNVYRPALNESCPKSIKLTLLADGPLVAVMLVEKAFPEKPTLQTLITVFADSEKFKIENCFAAENISPNEEHLFSFAFHIPEGKWRTQPTYLTYYGDNYGIDWVGPNPDKAEIQDSTVISRISLKTDETAFEYWLWPYIGPFSEEIASRFATKIQKPLQISAERKD